MAVLGVKYGTARAELLRPKEVIRSQKENKPKGIYYPSEISECEVQYMILGGLRKMGIDARAEVFSIDHTSRFDIVIFVNQVPHGIIEVKKRGKAFKRNPHVRHDGVTENKKQRSRYLSFGLPLKYALGPKSVLEAVRWGKALHSQAVALARVDQVLPNPGALMVLQGVPA